MSFTNSSATSKPRFIATAIALIAALATISITAAGAFASSGGVGTESGTGTGASPDPEASGLNESSPKYERLWESVSAANKRWARDTSECESGRDPDAIGSGGTYRGAFQFTQETWEGSPKTPGGDPTEYDYKTQAVVAVALKLRDGAGHWPVCG